jgi:hypothetical protein
VVVVVGGAVVAVVVGTVELVVLGRVVTAPSSARLAQALVERTTRRAAARSGRTARTLGP